MPQAGRAALCYLTHCVSQDSCLLATSLWRWHSFRWRWLGSDGGTVIKKITRHNCKICIILGFSKQLENGKIWPGEGKKKKKVVPWYEKLICSLQCMRSLKKESCRFPEEEGQTASLEKTEKLCIFPWAQLTSFLPKGCSMVTSHSNILSEWLKTVTLTRKLGHLQLQSAEVHSHTPYTSFGCYLNGVQVRGRYYRLNVLES